MEIKFLRKIEKNNVKATGFVEVSGVEINEIVVKQSEKGVFFEMPGKSYQDEKDNNEWKKAYHAKPISKEAAAKILEAVKEAVKNNAYRPLKSDKDKMQLGFINLVCDDVSIKVSLTDDGRIITPSRNYEKDGEKKYVNYVNLKPEQSEKIKAAFEVAIKAS